VKRETQAMTLTPHVLILTAYGLHQSQHASRFAQLALSCIQREFPYQPQHVVNHAGDVSLPRALHPAFYGCFDWHSAVHGHWLLVRVLRRHPSAPEAGAIRAALNAHLTAENLQTEAGYFRQPNRASFERPYGWAWALKLAHELTGWDDADGKNWRVNVQPLASMLVALYLDWLPRQTYPVRSGVHSNTAFGLTFALEYADAHAVVALSALIRRRSRDYFFGDRNYPAAWEPGGSDFLSPALCEADLMRRVLAPDEFAPWLDGFLPELPPSLLAPATVSDRGDGQLVHLDGLNLSRAWCLFNLAHALPVEDARRAAFVSVAERHLAAGLAHLTGGGYAGEHWLATFALLAMEGPVVTGW
jgi:hypothetical protein